MDRWNTLCPRPSTTWENPQSSNASTLCEVSFTCREDQIHGLLLEPIRPDQVSGSANGNGNNSIPGKISGIVLLPGSGITKEKEQGLARYLGSLGYVAVDSTLIDSKKGESSPFTTVIRVGKA